MGKGPSKVDVRAIRERTKKSMGNHGLLPPDLVRHVRPGAVFVAKDAAIHFPEDRLPGHTRTTHPSRRVIVCNDPTTCRSRAPKSLLVVPCTGSMIAPAAPWHFEIPKDEQAFSSERVVALPHLLMPILKADLLSFVGTMRPETFLALLARIAQNVGLVPGLGAPPVEGLELPDAVDSLPQGSSSSEAPK